MNVSTTTAVRKARANSRKNIGLSIPALCHHQATGQGYVRLNGKTFYLGHYGLEETIQKYHRVVAEWLTNNRQLKVDPNQITV